jgi:uncharacterized protein
MSTTPLEPSGSGLPPASSTPESPVFQTAPAPEPWRLRDLGFFIAYAVCTLLLSQFTALVVYAVLRPLMHWRTPPSALGTNPIFLLAAQSLFYVLILVFVYVMVAVHYGLPFWAALKWRRVGARRTLRFLWGGILMAFAVLLASRVSPDTKPFPLEQMFSSPAAAYALGAFAVVVAPFMEELIFRGVLFTFFERHAGVRFAVLSTGVLFGAFHVPEYWGAWTHVLLILLVGLVFSLTRGVTDSLAPSVILHMGYNASLMVLLFFATHHFRAVQAAVCH